MAKADDLTTSLPPYLIQVASACGGHVVVLIADNGQAIDGADTAGDDSIVVARSESSIETATKCLDSLQATTPSAVRIWLRGVILSSLAFEIAHIGNDLDKLNSLIVSESRVAVAECNDPVILNGGEPFDNVRTVLHIALQRDAKIFTFPGATPIDYYKSDLRECAVKIQYAVSF